MAVTLTDYNGYQDADMTDIEDSELSGTAYDSTYGTSPSSPSSSSSSSSLSDTSGSSSLSGLDQFGYTYKQWMRCVNHIGASLTLTPWDGCHGNYHHALNLTGYGDLTQETLSVGDLENAIHPLFDSRRFIKDTEDTSVQKKLWDALVPALQLASRMLTSAPVMAFLRRLKYGIEVTDNASAHKVIASSGVEDLPLTDLDVEVDLLELSKKLKFLFGAIKAEPDESQTHAFHTILSEEVGEIAFIRCDLPANPSEFHYIVINETYGHYFKHSQKRTLDRDQKTQWSLATTLVHEIAHAYYVRDRWDGDEDYMEPRYDRSISTSKDEPELGQHAGVPELGEQLDFVLYGATVNNIVHPEFGAFSEHWSPLFATNGNQTARSQSHIIFPTCPQYIMSWFQEGKWAKLEKKWSKLQDKSLIRQSKDFYVPKSDWGVVRESLYENGPWLWTPRKKLMDTTEAIKLTQNHTGACIEQYEARDRTAVKRLQKSLA